MKSFAEQPSSDREKIDILFFDELKHGILHC